MSRKRRSPEQVTGILSEVEVRISQGGKIREICLSAGITDQTYYRWRREYG